MFSGTQLVAIQTISHQLTMHNFRLESEVIKLRLRFMHMLKKIT